MATSLARDGRSWARRLALFALIALFVGLIALFLGTSVAPCLGITPETRTICVEQWEAQKGALQRLHDTFGPWSFSVVTFVALVIAAAGIDRLRTRR